MKTYRVGIVGFGMIGKVHAFAYATLPYYANWPDAAFRVTHVATAHAETAEKARRICGADVATTDFRDVTENPDVDIVHICTPNDAHLEPLLSAVRSGKPIYCEKPLTTSREEALRVREALEAHRYAATSQMTFHNRFFPAIRRARRLLREGRIGRLYQFRFAYLHSSGADPNTPFRWKHSESGGVVRDLASHALDLADDLVGPFESLLAETQRAVAERPKDASTDGERVEVRSEDAVTILGRTASGALGVVEATKIATGNEDELLVEIYGDRGALRFRLMEPHYLEFFDAGVPDRPWGGESGWTRIHCGARFEPPDTDFPSPKATAGWIRAHVASLSNFLHAVVEDRSTAPDLLQGVKIDCLIDTIFRSAYSRSWVDCETPGPSSDFYPPS